MRILALIASLLLSVAASATDTFNTNDKNFAPTDYGTSAYCWTSNGAGVLPSWQACSSSSAALTNTHIFVGSGLNVATDVALSRDCTMANTGAITCTKTNNVAFATSATTDTTNAANIASGTLAAARGGAGTITGALKGNGAGLVTQAACGDLSNGATGCSTVVGTAATAATGTSGATLPFLNGANTWSGVQSFNSSDLALKGATSGTITLNAAATAGSSTLTLPAGTTDFSATGGASQVVKQTSSGGAFTVARLACSDLSNAATSCSTDTTSADNISSGTLGAARGGTGVSNNAASTLTISGAFATTLTVSNTTNVTLPTSGTLATTVASGTSGLGTSLIASGACATVVTTAATGTATTDVIGATFNADPTAVTGYSASANGMLTIISYPTANNVNFKVCNNTASSITPGAITLNWRVVR